MQDDDDNRLSLGLEGVDEVMHGGLLPARAYMLRDEAGTGKTVFGFHYLTAGTDAGESCLFVAFEELESDIRANAATLGFDLDGVETLDLSPDRVFVDPITQPQYLSADDYQFRQEITGLMSYLEVRGEIRKAVGVLKKCFGDFEPTLCELRITGDGLWIGTPLNDLRGVLTGTPEWTNGEDG